MRSKSTKLISDQEVCALVWQICPNKTNKMHSQTNSFVFEFLLYQRLSFFIFKHLLVLNLKLFNFLFGTAKYLFNSFFVALIFTLALYNFCVQVLIFWLLSFSFCTNFLMLYSMALFSSLTTLPAFAMEMSSVHSNCSTFSPRLPCLLWRSSISSSLVLFSLTSTS